MKRKKQEEIRSAIKVNNMNLLLEADYSSVDSIIDGLKENKIHIKNGKALANDIDFKVWLRTFVNQMNKNNIPIAKVFNVVVNKKLKKDLTSTEVDALRYYSKYKQSPNFKKFINEFETTEMSLTEFHNKVQEMADNTKNGQRALRKSQTNEEDIETIYSKNGWTVVAPKTWQASIKAATFSFGKAPWCTASSQAETYFPHYTENGKYKLFIVSGGTKDKTLQVTFSPDNADLEGWNNNGEIPDLSKIPDEVLKVCKSGNKSLYEFARLNNKYKNVVKTKTDKNGWTSKTTLYPFGKDNFHQWFPRYVNGDYDSFEKIKANIKKDGVDSYVRKDYIKGDRSIWQSSYHGKKIFDKNSKDPNDDFWGVISNPGYEKEKDLPRKVKSDIYQRKHRQERAGLKIDDKDFALEKQTVKPDNPNYDKLFELGIGKYDVKKGEDVVMAAHYLAPINTQKRYPVIYIKNKIITSSDRELFKFCIVHFFKKYVKDWQKRGNLLHDVMNGNELEEEWQQKVLNILK